MVKSNTESGAASMVLGLAQRNRERMTFPEQSLGLSGVLPRQNVRAVCKSGELWRSSRERGLPLHYTLNLCLDKTFDISFFISFCISFNEYVLSSDFCTHFSGILRRCIRQKKRAGFCARGHDERNSFIVNKTKLNNAFGSQFAAGSLH